MDWEALGLSLRLGLLTIAILLPPALLLGRWLATTGWPGKPLVEALVVLPLVLPPTVVGFYLLAAMGPDSPVGRACLSTTKAQIDSPVVSSGLPTTAASATIGLATSADSISIVPMR